jgi:predicted Zn-dependent peptidase
MLPMLDHTLSKLSSKLSVVTVPMPGVKSVTVMALANTGSRYETEKEQGIAHFFEHIVFKGTEKYPEPQILAGAIDAIGADFNAFTSKEYTGYYVKSASKHIGTSLDVVSDMLLAPKIRQADIEREKGVIIEEINMYEDNPMRQVGNLFENMVFNGSGLGHDILGTKETVSAVTSEKFRAFLDKWYGLENMLLVVAGDEEVVTTKETQKLIEEAFSKDAGKRKAKRTDTRELSMKEMKISDQKLLVKYKKTEQAHLSLGWPGLDREDYRRFALSLLSTILGTSMSSRLFTEIREKRGLCYYVHSDNDYYHNTGIFGGSAGVDPSRTEQAVQVMLEEFYSVVDGTKPITKEELKKAKDYISGTMVLSLEDSRSVAQFFGMKQLLSQSMISPEDLLKKFQDLTLEEVQQVAQDVIQKGECRLAVIGPFKSDKAFAKILKDSAKK